MRNFVASGTLSLVDSYMQSELGLGPYTTGINARRRRTTHTCSAALLRNSVNVKSSQATD